MKISIITVCFNSELTIEETINSVNNQSYNNVEHIIIDGKSSDKTLKIINKYKNKIDIIISEKDKGLYYAMNKGIKLAKGDVIGILNSDDLFYSENTLKNIVKHFESDNSLNLLYGNILYFNSGNHKVKRLWKSKSYFEKFFDYGNVPPHPSVFVKREIYTYNNFNTDFKIAADYELLIRLLKKEKVKSKFLNEIIVKMREGGISTNNQNLIKQNKEVIESWKINELTIPWYFFILRFINKIKQIKF
jgi:glycosyltransferase involved in cell wall biosynthesis